MSGMLDGIRIVSFAQLLQAPAGVQLLSDLGAETIKIERPGAGAWERAWSGGGHWVGGESLLLIAAGRNQRSLTVDLKTPEGQEIIWKLIDQADVVVENYRPGVMDRIGFGFEAVHKRNPKVVYCAASGYGSSGPYLNRPGQDLLAQAMSGITSMSGKASDPPTPIGFAPVDQHSAALIAFGIMTALFHRSRTGLGQKVEVNLLTSALDLMAEPLTYLMNGAKIGQRSPAGLASGFHPGPYGVYQTQDGWIALSQNPLPKLASLLELPELEQYPANIDAWNNKERICEIIRPVMVYKTTAAWLELLLTADIWCAPVRTLSEVENDPQVQHLGMIQELEHPTAGTLKVVRHPVFYSAAEPSIRRHPPLVGEHTDEVLTELGYSESEISSLHTAGAV